jgi:AraC family transcriptional regulator, activator of mtrCDE
MSAPGPRPLNQLMKSTIAPADIDSLMTGLEVEFVKLLECLVSPGWCLSLSGTEVPGIHYNLAGMGRLVIGETPPIPIAPHTLVIIPAGTAFRLEAMGDTAYGSSGAVESRSFPLVPGALRKLVAGDRQPEIILICGYFRASYGTKIDLFGLLPAPIVETFRAEDQVDQTLKAALAELVAQEVGAGAMSSTLLKQVLLRVLRRSLADANLWSERFTALSDPNIARAFAAMVIRPAAAHTVQTLADTSGLSRSTFMSRFTEAFGDSPITVLRQLRMRRARILLATHTLTVDQVAEAVGYSSRPAFYRAFRNVYGENPSQ